MLNRPDPAVLYGQTSLDQGRVLQTDRFGFQELGKFSFGLSEQSRLYVVDTDSLPQRFLGSPTTQMLEHQVELRLEVDADRGTHWFTQLKSLSSHQGIESIGGTDGWVDRYRESAYSILQGWKQELGKGLWIEFALGAARCQSQSLGTDDVHPIGTFRLRKDAGIVSVTARGGQDVRGGSSATGIYGMQIEQSGGFEGSVQISDRIRFILDCVLARADGAFRREKILGSAYILTASADLAVQWSSHLQTKFGFSNRQMFSEADLIRGAAGPMAMVSFLYRFS
ncbi:MAG TPA: hypothetical protein VI895_07645 [Bdellovibrionota bacterium]|nr:hypothetical protein [Bdellovibrionota bacterium]